jgi:uncharacterized protein YpmS
MIEGCKGCCVAIILIPVLCCVLVACAAIYVYTSGPEPPLSSRFKPNAADAQAFDNAITSAQNDAQISRGFTLFFTEKQLSSWMALNGKQFADEHGHAFPFTKVQVGLDNGDMTFYGELTRSNLKLPVEVIIRPEVDGAGKLKLAITSVNIGGVKTPDFVLKTVSRALEDRLAGPFEQVGNYVLDPASLSVDGGIFTVRGQIVP